MGTMSSFASVAFFIHNHLTPRFSLKPSHFAISLSLSNLQTWSRNTNWMMTATHCMMGASCEIVALMVLGQVFWYLRTIGLRISPYQKLLKVCGENLAHLFRKLLSWKKGPRTIKHICIVSLDIYLHSSIFTFLLIIISSSLL
jgi:hypothetical protein